MSMWGIGMAFLIFWSMTGVGAYLALSSFNRLRQAHLLNRGSHGSVRMTRAKESVRDVVNILLLFTGLALVFEGFWFTYNVVFG